MANHQAEVIKEINMAFPKNNMHYCNRCGATPNGGLSVPAKFNIKLKVIVTRLSRVD